MRRWLDSHRDRLMPSERFYVEGSLEGGVSIEGTEFHHLAHVMRVRVGEEIELVNGRGCLARGKVSSIDKHQAVVDILSLHSESLRELSYILAVPLMRPAKMELVLEKGTELGADAFWLYRAHHSEKEEISENQWERLRLISISAMKQCGRLDLPHLRHFLRFEEIFEEPLPYFFGDTRPGAQKISPQERGIFITGPERGFSEKELKILEERALGVTLHKNILRAETAPLVALLKLQS